ncbi:MAG: DNA gyrase subunit A [Pseudomonadota bacterium]|nr:DNA gyrase subunit A [Pseudomonadota bacterium]
MDTNFARLLVPIQIEEEMRSSYLDYSMSVIVGRALPDVRDGLKPVHRRVLYAMLRNGLVHNRAYRKCANVVGEVLGKYHPHGDASVYDALVRMAQPWNMRYLLVDGQGNFGSVDGDNAAAYRYTECRMTALAEQLLVDIDKETVNFTPNFDGRNEEPEVLPAAFPNLLVNGSEGIAVGMATKIPPNNLTEVINGLLALIENPDIDIEGLMKHIPAPDFPTAGTIYGYEGVREAYTTGRGRLIVRGKIEFEEVENREAIIITELPFQVNKARLQEEIADQVKEKRLEGIHAIRDESDRQGMRVVIELKRDAVREVVVNHLYKQTQLQNTFGIIFLAIVQQRPQILNLKELLQHYLGHRREVTLRRTRYELRKARERAHILEGLRIALDHIDAVIALIRASRTTDDARAGLMATFALSEVQSQAILDMRLQRLVGLERDKIEEEYKELMGRIEWLLSILGDEKVLFDLIRTELTAIRDQFGDARRTNIIGDSASLTLNDLIAEEEQVVTLSRLGYIKRTSMTEFRMQKRGGLGKTGMNTRDQDVVTDIFLANTHGYILAFTNTGRLYWVRVYDLPEAAPNARGKPIVNFAQLASGEKVASVVSVKDFGEPLDLIFVSRRGFVKRTPLSAYGNVRAAGLAACDLVDGDEVLRVSLAERGADILLATKRGRALRFAGSKVRQMGRIARGVRGIKLRNEEDAVVDLAVLSTEGVSFLVTVTANGYGKRTALADYPTKGRGTGGVLDIVADARNGDVVATVAMDDGDQLLLITDSGRIIRMRLEDIRLVGRRTRGVRLMRLSDDERIVAVERILRDTADAVGDALAPEDKPPEAEADEAVDAADDAAEEGDDEALDEGDEAEADEGETDE